MDHNLPMVINDRRAIASLPVRVQRSLFSAATTPARHIRWKIILPFVFLSMVLGLTGTYLTTRMVAGSLEERFDNQLAETARAGSDAFARRERKQLETVRAISLTEGVGHALANGDRNALQRLVLPQAVNAGAERIEIIDAAGSLRFGAMLSEPKSLRYDEIATGENYSAWQVVRNALAGGAAEDKFTSVVMSGSGPHFVTAGPVYQGGLIVGAVAVSAPLSTVLAQARAEALGDVTVYGAGGVLLATSFKAMGQTTPRS